jgi:hypothetical protein
MTAHAATAQDNAPVALDPDGLVNAIEMSAEDQAYFDKHGFLKLKGILTPLAVDALREVAEERVAAAASIGATYGETFSRLSYGLASAEVFKAIYTSRQFRKTIGELLKTRIIATECNGFEMQPGRSGFPWHYGSLSFRFVRPEDMAWSIWIPLDKIDPADQGGGMAYVSQDTMSCAFNYQMSAMLAEMKAKDQPIDEITEALDRVFGFQGPLATDLFERHATEDAFDVGDAFIFNKNVWHRSSPLKEGPMKRRLAVNMRFVDWRARLDMERYTGESETGGGLGLGVNFGSQKQTSYGSQFDDIPNGGFLRESRHCGTII